MTPNDKLPQTTQERIKADAERYAGLMVWVNTSNDPDKEPLFHEHISSTSYEAGATAVHERAQAAIDILQEAYDSHVEEKRLLVERYPHLFPNIDNYIKPWVAKAKEFLQQWKDGKKEVGDETA